MRVKYLALSSFRLYYIMNIKPFMILALQSVFASKLAVRVKYLALSSFRLYYIMNIKPFMILALQSVFASKLANTSFRLYYIIHIYRYYNTFLLMEQLRIKKRSIASTKLVFAFAPFHYL